MIIVIIPLNISARICQFDW